MCRKVRFPIGGKGNGLLLLVVRTIAGNDFPTVFADKFVVFRQSSIAKGFSTIALSPRYVTLTAEGNVPYFMLSTADSCRLMLSTIIILTVSRMRAFAVSHIEI